MLEYFIRLSKKRCLETDVLNVYGDSLETITDLIYDALNNEYYTVKPRPENQQRKSLNLQHLRQANILDDLWNHLKSAYRFPSLCLVLKLKITFIVVCFRMRNCIESAELPS